MVEGHKIVKSIPLEYYLNLIADYSNDEIIISDHTMFRIREKDRKIFKDNILKYFIEKIAPTFVGLQKNGCYAVFYDYEKNNILKIIIDIRSASITIVTFYIIAKSSVPIIK
jgi:hypothetical protein